MPSPLEKGTILLSISEGGHSHLFTYNPFTTGFTRLTEGSWDDVSPALSPDRRYLAFSSNRDRQWDLYLLEMESGQTVRLTNTTQYDGAPSWLRKVPSSKDPERFHHFFGRIEREFVTSGTRLVFYSLSMMEHIWGREAIRNFFGHVCPALYAYETLAYWLIIKGAHSEEFIATIEHMTQVVLDLSKDQERTFLTVKKGGSRYSPSTYRRREYTTDGLKISFK